MTDDLRVEKAPSAFGEALSRLEQATDSLLSTEFNDLAALALALESRADALTLLALAAGDEPAPHVPEDTLTRMTQVLVRGEEATRKLITQRRELAADWSRQNQVARAQSETASEPTPAQLDVCA